MRHVIRSLFVFGLIVFTSMVTAAQPVNPEITSFVAEYQRLDHAALADRAIRIPVSWTTVNRPITANLFFEQVLPDGSAINVELPRLIPWVATSGQGWAAPILPNPDTGQVVLRVRLVDLLTSSVYSERQLTLPIGTVPGQRASFGNMPTISRFATCCPTVNSNDLMNGSARVPVSWQAVNRPLTSNLVFEQMLADGTVINVELPRGNPWVASSGEGVVAPRWPGGSPTNIRLRVRLVDLLNGRVYDQREINPTIIEVGTQPVIRFFTTPATNVSRRELNTRLARVNVSWAVDNRPQNTNLFFEQVLADGSVRNIELPRDNPWIASSGNGVVAPFPPGGNAAEILIRLRVANLSGGTTLAAREIRLPIIEDVTPTNFVVYEPSQCFNSPFEPSHGIQVGVQGRMASIGGRLTLTSITGDMRGSEGAGAIADLTGGERFTVTSGPYCYHRVGEADVRTFREWFIHLDDINLDGWMREYDDNGDSFILFMEPIVDQDNPITINAFTVTPDPVERGGTVTLSWDVTGTSTVNITRLSEVGDIYLESIASSSDAAGSFTYTIPSDYINSVSFILNTDDSAVSEIARISIICPFSGSMIPGECPITQHAIEAAYQPFQGGFMIWRKDTSVIYVLYTGGQYEEVQDTWVEGETIDIGEVPPDGFIQPERGFGKVWVTQAGVRDRLGWATAYESSYSTPLETHQSWFGRYPTQTVHFQLPDGRTLHLEGLSGWRTG